MIVAQLLGAPGTPVGNVAAPTFAIVPGPGAYAAQEQEEASSCGTPRRSSAGVDTLRGCRFIYVDLGSNIGLQLKKLYEPAVCPTAPVQRIFSHHFLQGRRGVCSLAVEPNPDHAHKLRGLCERYSTNGSHVQVLEAAAAATEGTANFFFNLRKADGHHHHAWGASLTEHTPSTAAAAEGAGGATSVQVATVDAAALLRRVLPPPGANSTVVMKLDVEGEESRLVPRLLAAGVLCGIAEVYYEAHGSEAHRVIGGAADQLKRAGCGVALTQLDDESGCGEMSQRSR